MQLATKKHFFTLLLTTFCLLSKAQEATIFGRVTDIKGTPIYEANVTYGTNGTFTNKDGTYELNIPADKEVAIEITHVQHKTEVIRVNLKPSQRLEQNVVLIEGKTVLNPVQLVDESDRFTTITKLDPAEIEMLSGPVNSVESLVKTLPGVVSNNELSSQYSVRGGNFDENLVYVNGIQVYRSFLPKTGQQEGLSFINPDMVDDITFSAGGFQAKYGDKLSSVLDITYKQPEEFGATVQAGLQGTSLSLEYSKARFSGITGFRYRTNRRVLGSLDTEADYTPTFIDLQTYLTYHIDDEWELNFLGNIARNTYDIVPKTRQTDFGTVAEALRLTVFFDGQEKDQYQTYFGALSTLYKPNDRTRLQFTASGFQTIEEENFDILGQYRINELDLDLGSDNFGEIAGQRGVGGFLNHGRNNLDAIIFNVEHKGSIIKGDRTYSWGVRFQHEDIIDDLKEWEYIDSAGYSVPHNDFVIDTINNRPVDNTAGIELFESLDSEVNLISNRVSGFIQVEDKYDIKSGTIFYSAGLRANHWDLNEQTVFSPRTTLSYKPKWQKDMVFRASAGYYHQPPFYRELRNREGIVSTNVRAQESIHFVLGNDYEFKAWGRPFKLVTEVYYKILNDIVPYEVENVRIRYLGQNNAHGFARGIDMRVNGEFVKGVQSWASVSVLSIQEDIDGDGHGFIPKPTDQRVTVNLFFQDYLPNDPTVRVSLNLTYGSGLPFGAPKTERHEQIRRIPAYRRVDIGFSKLIKAKDKTYKKAKFLNNFETIWVGVDVFNLFEIRNTVSYLWVRDISAENQFAVPNFLTNRLINLRVVAKI